ncbi:MAG: GAF domain-containing protein [Pseudomonadota bacterium]|nr:GAF domain-containing protein [Pseudomonadota bacterium]MDQ3229324.1 GAF domain-containing protein [Pseudomonadota bacterium]
MANLPDEASRLRSLASFDVLDTPPQAMFDQVVQVASLLCATPIGLVSLVDRDRLFFMARVGVEVDQVPNQNSLCSHAILTPQTMLEVHDASSDPRFADSPLVTGPPGIRFYAGVPLVSIEGETIGTLCVIDRQPRTLNESQRVALAALAEITMELLEGRRREMLLQQRLVVSELQGQQRTQ